LSDLLNLIISYPWLPSLNEYYSNLKDIDKDINRKAFISQLFSSNDSDEISFRTYEFFKTAIERKKHENSYKLDKLNVSLYLLIKILLAVLNDKILTNRIAELYSSMNYNYLLEDNDFHIYQICKEELKLNVIYNQKGEKFSVRVYENSPQPRKTNFKIDFIDFLKLSRFLKDDHRKLVNNFLSNGYLYLEKERLIRLIQEHVRSKILEVENKELEQREVESLFEIESFKELYEKILVFWKKRKEELPNLEFDGTEDPAVYPPCIQELRTKAKEGQNLIHIERVVIVFFLLALNISVEDIVKLFSNLPDFDQEKTRYQVQFMRRKEYKVHSCETLKSYDLCRASQYNDEICLKGYYSKTQEKEKRIRSPLQYIYVKKYRSKKRNSNQRE